MFMDNVREVKLSTKGQIVIPHWIRERLSIKAGDRLRIELRGEEIVLRPATKLSKLRGVDRIYEASKKLKEIRKGWDDEFAVRH